MIFSPFLAAASQKLYMALVDVKLKDTGLPGVNANNTNVKAVLQLIFAIIALVTVIYIIITGLKLIVQQGDPQGISKARQGIIYAALGLLIALSAEIIVTFVVDQL